MRSSQILVRVFLVMWFSSRLYAGDLKSEFASAPEAFSPVPIWWWSGGAVDREGISQQLGKLAEGGIHNAILLNLAPSGPLYGSAADEPPFMTEEWWDLFAHTLEVGKKVGVKIWFYDQLGFSGSGLQARVVRDHPDFRGVNLDRVIQDVTGPIQVRLEAPPGGKVLAAFISEQASGDAERGLGTPLRKVEDLTASMTGNGCTVEVPAGAHRVHLYFTTAGGFDYQNPEAGAALIDVVHGEMERRFGGELGKGIAGSFQDEFPALPRFSVRMPKEFQERTGYDLLEKLPALFDDVIDNFGESEGPTTVQIRCDANDVAALLCEKAFFIPLHQWHEKYGLLCGYDQTNRNADPIRGERYYLDYFKTMRHYSVPGNDMDGDCKPHQSIADLYNRPRVWAEVFHSSGWGQTLEEINTLLNPWLYNGGTLYNPHAVYYSIHGSYWEWAPPDTGWRQPYFVHNSVFADHIARTTYALAQGKHEVRAAILHPSSTIHTLCGFGSPSPLATRVQSLYWGIQESLRAACLDYLVLDQDSLTSATVEGDTLVANGLRLKVVFLPGTQALPGDSVAKLARFADQGGTVAMVGEPPRFATDRSLNAKEYQSALDLLRAKAVKLEDGSKAAEVFAEHLPRDMQEILPVLRRKVEGSYLFFILSDNETKQDGRERFDINKRKLWETAAAKGERMSFTLDADGVPERWNTLTGEILPILNYRREDGKTRVDIDLTDTPAPLLSIRPAGPQDPVAIDSDLDVLDWKRDPSGDTLTVRGLQRFGTEPPVAPDSTVRVALAEGVFTGRASGEPVASIEIPAPFDCSLVPTCDNSDGSFAWPPSPGPIPVEVRSAKFRLEAEGEDSSQWKDSVYNDSEWKTSLFSFGPRAEWTGPLSLPAGTDWSSIETPPTNLSDFRPAVYSLKLGIDEDPVFRSALGGKGRIPEEFIDLGAVKAGELYLIRATAAFQGNRPLETILRVGGSCDRRVFLNGKEVSFETSPNATRSRARVVLQPGDNRLEVMASRKTEGRLRLFYHFLPPTDALEDPEWIWSSAPSPSGQSLFVRELEIPGKVQTGAMVVALGDLHRIRINGTLVADQGNFDPYFTSRAERYDITPFLVTGKNRIEIEARDTGQPTGLLADGLVILEGGSEIPFVSNDKFQVSAVGAEPAVFAPAALLAGPAHSYMGDPALMLLRPRPHPLPQAGWLAGQPAPSAPFDQIVFSTGNPKPAAGWYRSLVPPGATALALKTLGEATLYIDGQPAPLVQDGATFRAELPHPDQETRMLALRIEPRTGYEEGAALLEPITFTLALGRIGYGSWDQLGLPHYCGGMIYKTSVELTPESDKRFFLDLGRVRGTAEVRLNGKPCGVRLWHPYRYDLSAAVQSGENRLEIEIYNTLGPHFSIGHPGGHVYEGHTTSGLFGPVRIYEPKEVTLQAVKNEG